MPFFTSSDKALWHLALPMIFSNITVPLLGLVDTAVIGHLDSPVYLGGVAVGATATSFLLCCCFSAHEHHGSYCPGIWCEKSAGAGARAGAAANAGAGRGLLIALFRTPIIDVALHIVGEVKRYWNKPGVSLKSAGSAHPPRWLIWCCSAGCLAFSMRVRRLSC